MPNASEYEKAAKKTPNNRSVAEQALVDEAYKVGMFNVKNIDDAAKKHAKIYGDK